MAVLTRIQVLAILGVLQTNPNTTVDFNDIINAIDASAPNSHLLHFDQIQGGRHHGRYKLSTQSGFHTMVGYYRDNWRSFWIGLHDVPIPYYLGNVHTPDPPQRVTTAAPTSASTSAPATTSTSAPTSAPP